MVFNSLTFVVFLGVVLASALLAPTWRARKLHLLLLSYAFYAAWNPPFVALLWLSTWVDWVVARRLVRTSSPPGRKALVALSAVINLGILATFKYGDLLVDGFTAAAAAAGFQVELTAPGLLLPIGISFYTFQTMSYTIDVYRGGLRPADSLLDFALFVAFFPQLVAGPIVRAGQFLPQCAAEPRPSADDRAGGLTQLVQGLVMKMVLADWLFAPIADRVYRSPGLASSLDLWLGTIAFSGQIYLDFAGYSLCAIGLAAMLGFRLPQNFDGTYSCIGFRDFWRRWHITLSAWFRDYLFVPLGGSRGGGARTIANIMLTMTLCGLWHGASVKLIVFGALHGAYLCSERLLFPNARGWTAGWTASSIAGWAVTHIALMLSWVVFRSPDLTVAGRLLPRLFTGPWQLDLLSPRNAATSLLLYTGLVALHAYRRVHRPGDLVHRLPAWALSTALAVLVLLLALVPVDTRAFIYFQF